METFIPGLIGWLIVLTLALSTLSFGYMGRFTLRRFWPRAFAWTCCAVYLCVTGLAISLIV